LAKGQNHHLCTGQRHPHLVRTLRHGEGNKSLNFALRLGLQALSNLESRDEITERRLKRLEDQFRVLMDYVATLPTAPPPSPPELAMPFVGTMAPNLAGSLAVNLARGTVPTSQSVPMSPLMPGIYNPHQEPIYTGLGQPLVNNVTMPLYGSLPGLFMSNVKQEPEAKPASKPLTLEDLI
jgi:hypothetical protein